MVSETDKQTWTGTAPNPHTADTIVKMLLIFPKQPSTDQKHIFPISLVSPLSRLWVFVVSLFRSCLLSHAVWVFWGSPGDKVLLSHLMNRHRQNESSSVLPKARLCPQGGLPGRISMRSVGSDRTACDKPRAPFAPHTLNGIIQPCLHRRARSMGWTEHANSCQGDTPAW